MTALPAPGRPRKALPTVLLTALLVVLVVLPMGFVLLAAFVDGAPRPGNLGNLAPSLKNLAILGSDYALGALGNSFMVATAAALGGLAIGASLAFLCARTDVPGRRLIYLSGLMPLFLPSYVGALAWAILAGPSAGLINVGLRDLGIDAMVDIYGIGGLAFVLAIYNAPYAFLFVHGALVLMSPDLEDAASIHGAAMRRVLGKVTFPLLLPALMGSGVLIFGLSIENFAVSQVIGNPARVDTLPTLIYRLMSSFPARANEAAAVAVALTLLVLAVTLLQRRLVGRRSFATVTGKGMRPRAIALGAWRWPVFAGAMCYFLVAVLLPFAALLVVAFNRSQFLAGFAQLAQPGALSTRAFAAIFSTSLFHEAVWNSVVVSLAAALVGTTLCLVLAYVVYRTKAAGRALIEYLAMMPLAVPALVFGLGLLWTWLVMPIPIYGTLAVLVVAFVAHQIPQGFRGVASFILQTHADLEDSAVMLGASRLRAIGAVTLPLMKTGLTSTFLLLLLLSMRELSVPLFLFTSETRLLSIFIFDDLENGLLQRAAAVSIVYSLLILCFAAVTMRLGRVSFNNHG